MKHQLRNLLLLGVVLFTACKKNNTVSNIDTNKKIAPDGFNFSTSKKVDLNIRLLSNNNQPLKGVVVSFYSPKSLSANAAIYKAVTDKNGYLSGSVNIPAYLGYLIVKPNYTGLINDAKAIVTNNLISGVIGGVAGLSGNIEKTALNSKVYNGRSFLDKMSSTLYEYMGTYTGDGAPISYLEPTPDVITPDLLSFITYSLPEVQDVRIHHPSYVSNGAASSLNIVKTADVWITFISEHAGNRNSVGWYQYATNTPPQTVDDIDKIHYLYPNASMTNSGGSINSGDKVKLGRFSPGTSIGFVLFRNAWNDGTHIVDNNNEKYFSNSNLNPEPTADLKRHTVLLNYPAQHLYVVGFEDLNRTDPACDHDFNDITVYASANPVDGISDTGIPPLDTPIDTDGDGVTDVFDEYPTDPERAFDNYFPARNNYATLVFEDKWPLTFDYDLNDLVVSYQYKFVSNAQNNIVEFYSKFAPIAAGASYRNGFGVQLPLSPSLISQVTGQKITGSYINLSPNGTEQGQNNAVIIPFDNHQSLISQNAIGSYYNTIMSNSKLTGDTAKVYVKFTAPVSNSTLGLAPFNPFLISDMKRGYEVHLPGNAPTQQAAAYLFGTNNDNSNSALNRYYLTVNNEPWALSFTEPFQYPIETKDIRDAYLHFSEWALSGGNNYADWYTNLGSGFRNNALIYTK